MNRAEFLEIIKNGGGATGKDISDLDQLIKLYPWFQSAYSVVLNDLFRSGSFNFENNLKKSAIYIADREVLYYLLNGENVAEGGSSIKSEADFSKGSSPSEPLLKEEGAGSQMDSDSTAGRSREELMDEINRRLSEIEEGKKGESMLVLDEEATDPEYKDEKPDLEPLSRVDKGLLDLDYPSTDSRVEDKSLTQKKTVENEADLVNRFLVNNPRIEAKADTSVTELEDITKSIDDREEGLVSETLASIYLKQKYYTRAIMIYEKLSLKYPEKSSYFAAQIEKIKELIS